MSISLDVVRQVRESTGAGIVDVKKALEETGGDQEKAVTLLRKKGKSAAAKKAGRTAHEGVIGSYVHSNWKIGAFVALACETDFVARNQAFRDLAHELALHVAAANPTYLSSADVPSHVLEQEKDIVRGQMAEPKKPEAVLEKILEGKLKAFYEQNCLLQQRFVKDDSKTIEDLLDEATGTIGEKIVINNFIRFEL